VNIDQGIGQVDATGTRVISPAASTVYTISAINYAGTVTGSAMITVNSASPQLVRTPAVITDFSNSLNSDGTSTLTWNVTGADMVSIDQYIGIVNASGTKIVPATPAVYTLTASYVVGNTSNDIGTVTKSVTTGTNVSDTQWGR
jgi:hypothetical protein